MSSSSTTNKFNFMTDSFKEETPKAVGEEKTTDSKVADEPVKEGSTNKATQKKPKSSEKATPEIAPPMQQSTKKTPTKSNSSNKEKKPSVPAAAVKNRETEELETIGKRSDPNYKTVGIMLPLKAHKRAKILLMDDPEERDFSDLMTDLLTDWLTEQGS